MPSEAPGLERAGQGSPALDQSTPGGFGLAFKPVKRQAQCGAAALSVVEDLGGLEAVLPDNRAVPEDGVLKRLFFRE